MAHPGRAGGLQPLTYLVLVVGASVVIAFSSLTLAVHDRTEQHLLQLQVRDAASTLAAGLPGIQSEMDDGLQVVRATGSPAAFRQFAADRILTQPSYRSVSLWRRTGGQVVPLSEVGARPALVADGRLAFLASLRPGAGIRVGPILPSGPGAVLGLADMPDQDGGLAVYAETALPPGRHITVPASSPYHVLQFALYVNAIRPPDLLESTGSTPIKGRRAVASDRFGDSSILVVGASRANLAGDLSADLPWIVLGAGLALTAFAAATAELLGRRRRRAEELAEENQRLYLEQRDIATTVQNALLPEVPTLEELEVGARYLAGTAGIDVGGDWYDVVCRPGTCTFVVGDVCGRGLRAATTMAAVRFATRAYIAQGDDPRRIVEKLARLQDFEDADLFATLLIGQIDIPSRRLTFVSAGHPPPLIVSPSGSSFVEVPPGPPVGVHGSPPPPATEVDLLPGALLVAYTDGLVERREQSLTRGLELLATARIDPSAPVEETLDRLVADLLPGGATDDTAILAVRWRPPSRLRSPSGSTSRSREVAAAPG